MQIPISGKEDSSKNGVFRYSQDIHAPSLRGVFAFSFYLHVPWQHPSANILQGDPYLKGIQMYVDAIEKADSVFGGWKVVLYTDKYTIDWLTELEHPIANNPTVLFCSVEWPYYQAQTAGSFKDQVNGDIMRCMRLRAFFDFSHIPVFVRDADTIWAMQISAYSKRISVEPAELYEWEANYLEGALRYPNTFIFSTSLGYKRFWHENKQGKRFAPLGAFAGLQSTMPVVPCFQDLSLWDTVVEYILARSQRSDLLVEGSASYSNQMESGRVGKDEQILIYILLPACVDHTFFFEFDMFSTRTFALKGKQYYKANYPAAIFERGNNANLRGLYTKAIATEFKQNLKTNLSAITQKNSAARSKREKQGIEMLKKIKDPLREHTKSIGIDNSIHSASGNYTYTLNQMIESFSPSEKLTGLFAQFETAQKEFTRLRSNCIYTFIYSNKNTNSECLGEVQEAAERRAGKAREFLDAFFVEHPRDAFVASKRIETRYLQPLLDWYDGKPLVPPAPVAAPVAAPAWGYNFLEEGEELVTKPFGRGGKTHKRKQNQKQKHKSQRKKLTRRK